jgi:hypothetical protein
LYLSDCIIKAPSDERINIIKTIEESSPVHWAHINLHGTFDFSNEALKDSLDFNIEEMFNFNWKGG